MQCFLFSLVEKKSSYVTRRQKIVEISSSGNSRRHVQHIFGPRIVEWPGYANMQIFMLIGQLDGFDPHKIRKLRANSNSNSKLELDVVWNSWWSQFSTFLLAFAIQVTVWSENSRYSVTTWSRGPWSRNRHTLRLWTNAQIPQVHDICIYEYTLCSADICEHSHWNALSSLIDCAGDNPRVP